MTKKTRLGLVLLALAGGVTQAQTWQGRYGTYTLSGCYHVRDGVRCDFPYSTKSGDSVLFSESSFETVTPEGGNLKASATSGGGKPFEKYGASVKVYRGIPVKVSVLFGLPKTQSNFRVLDVYGERIDNVSIGGTLATSNTPVSTSTAGVAINIAGNWNATLTNCKRTAGNTVVCTATLRK